MILTVVTGYPTEKDRTGNVFVHSRVKGYLDAGYNAQVYLLKKSAAVQSYCFEDVTVNAGGIKELLQFEANHKIDAICIHFLSLPLLRYLKKSCLHVPVMIVVHGNEALLWNERIFPYVIQSFNGFLRFVKYIIVNTITISKIRHFMKKNNLNLTIVCVSEWMRTVTIKNWKLQELSIPIEVVPNVINCEQFKYIEKDPAQRFYILVLRSFSHGKYAPDMVCDFLKQLSSIQEFSRYVVTIVGSGKLFNRYVDQFRVYPNVSIKKGFLNHEEVAKLHQNSGIFLCPTRQDAQGVSMCEAMSSGLIPIVNTSTAIPEFLPDDLCLRADTVNDMFNNYMKISASPQLFTQLSAKSAAFINEKCCFNQTIKREIELLTK